MKYIISNIKLSSLLNGNHEPMIYDVADDIVHKYRYTVTNFYQRYANDQSGNKSTAFYQGLDHLEWMITHAYV